MVYLAAEQIAANAIVAVVHATESAPSIPVVIGTGLTLVFGILIILYVVLLVQGKIFSKIDKAKQEQETATVAPVQNMPQQNNPVQNTPVVEEGISPEVVAAIAAAVTEFSEGQCKVQSVCHANTDTNKPLSAKSERRGRWGLAGVMSDTEPY